MLPFFLNLVFSGKCFSIVAIIMKRAWTLYYKRETASNGLHLYFRPLYIKARCPALHHRQPYVASFAQENMKYCYP